MMKVKFIRKIFPSIMRFQSTVSSKLVYREHGEPINVVHRCDQPIPTMKSNEILVKMIAAPVNPSDINTIEGKYPSRPPLPAVPGNEGVGIIISKGSGATNFEVGDHVVPFTDKLGTWQTHVVIDKNQVYKIPKELGLVEASTLTINPCTAYRMLKDFAKLERGDVIIQNGANSACGQNVIQLARIWGLKSVNIIRNRENVDELRCFLKNLGATEVLTEEELVNTDIFKNKKLAKPKLALNCVGGKNALQIMRQLDNGVTMVTYGGMSREPVTVPTSALIFKDVRVRGFWVTQWTKNNFDSRERQNMFNELISYMKTKELQGPAYKMVNFDNYKEALVNTMPLKGMNGFKYILDFNDCN